MKAAVKYVPLTEQEKQDIVKRSHEEFERKAVAMDSTTDSFIAKLNQIASEIREEKKAAVAVDHRTVVASTEYHRFRDDKALERLLAMKPEQRATAFERQARGENVGVDDKMMELRERCQIPEGQEQQQRNAIKDFWNGQHQRNTLNSDLKL